MKEQTIDFAKGQLYEALPYFPRSYVQIFPKDYKDSDGWKISIQGKSVDDVKFLCERLYDFLYFENVSFKVKTQRGFDVLQRLDNAHTREQVSKVFTIYCPKDIDIHDLCKMVEEKITDYKGHEDVPPPSAYKHYAGGMYIRNDRDKDGNYVSTEAEAMAKIAKAR